MEKTIAEIKGDKTQAEIEIYDTVRPIINKLQKEIGLPIVEIDIQLIDISCYETGKQNIVGDVKIKLNWEGGYE